MSLKDKLLKNSTIKLTSIIEDNEIFNCRSFAPTSIPMLNTALSGRITGGIGPGLTLWCGKSKHFKSLFTLVCMKGYLDHYPDAMAVFYDTEFGTPRAYFESLNIDMQRVVYTPITDMEKFKFDIMQQLDGIDRGEHVFFAVDSVGNMASRKEVDDAVSGKSVADMSRAKQMKSIWRMVTPHLTIKDLPMHVVNHIYMSQDFLPKAVVSGGEGIYLSADNIFIIGRQQDKKEGKPLEGYSFIVNIEKSRHVKEKMKIPITVKFSGGLNRWSGLVDEAVEAGFLVKGLQGWYNLVDQETGQILELKKREADMANSDFWLPVIANEKFQTFIGSKYRISTGDLIEDEVGAKEES